MQRIAVSYMYEISGIRLPCRIVFQQECVLMKKKFGILNRDLNLSGFAVLLLILLQYIAALFVYYIFAVNSGIHIRIGGFLPSDILKFIAKLKTADANMPEAMPAALLTATLIGNIIPFVLCAKFAKVKIGGIFSHSQLDAGKAAVYGIIAVGASLVASMLVNAIALLLKLLGLQLTMPSIKIPYNSVPGAVMMILSVVVAAPLTEEFICRGVLLNIFKRFGYVFAIVASSLVWALLHGNLVQGIPVFVLGLFFGAIAVKAKSILPTIIIHSINNALSLAENAIAQNKNFVSYLGAAAMNFSILTAAIILAALYLPPLFRHEKGGSARGFTAFFTCVPILAAIAVCMAMTILSVKKI